MYKSRASEFDECKASVLGEFVKSKLAMDEDENVLAAIPLTGYTGYLLTFFENGKVAKVDMSAFETKTNRKKLLNAYSGKSPAVAFRYVTEDRDFVLVTHITGLSSSPVTFRGA